MSLCRCGMPSFGYTGCYRCLKERRLNGGTLTGAELAFAWSVPSPSNGDGWMSADGWSRSLDPPDYVDAERVSMLAVLLRLGDMTEEIG